MKCPGFNHPVKDQSEGTGQVLFVYGTLKRGFGNHHVLCGATYFGRAETEENFALFIGDYPCASKALEISAIKGEVYHLKQGLLASIDAFEGEEYQRELTQVRLETGEVISAWIYFSKNHTGELNRVGEFVVKSP
jgi:gamma-glutamylaminecyclotransferase